MSFSSLFGGGSDKPKASIFCLDNPNWNVEADFNPTSFKYTRATEWALEQTIAMGHAWQRMAFKTGKVDDLELVLLFDESEDRSQTEAADFIPNVAALAPPSMQGSLPAAMQLDPNTESAMKKATALHRLTMPLNFGSEKEPQIRPPAVAFVWGPFEFYGFITSLSNEFVLFDEEGGVRRVKSTLKLQGQAINPVENVDALLDGSYVVPMAEHKSGKVQIATNDGRINFLTNLE